MPPIKRRPSSYDFETQIQLATDPDTPATVLRGLCVRKYPEVQRLLASNPSTPLDRLLKLSTAWPYEVGNNPALSMAWLTGEMGKYIDDYAGMFVEGISSQVRNMLEFLSPDEWLILAASEETDLEILDQASRCQKDADVRANAALNPRLTRDQMVMLMSDPADNVRIHLARNELLPYDLREIFARAELGPLPEGSGCPSYEYQDILRSILKTGPMSQAVYQEIWEFAFSKQHHWLEQHVIRSPWVGSQLLERAWRDDPHTIALELGHNPNTPVEIWREIRTMVARGTLIAPIDRALAMNMATPAEILVDLDPRVLFEEEYLRHPNLPPDFIRALYHRLGPEQQIPLAENFQVPDDVVEHMLGDRDFSYIEYLASNPGVKSERLQQIFEMADPFYQKQNLELWTILVTNPSTPVDLLRYLGSDEFKFAHKAALSQAWICSNPNIPLDMIDLELSRNNPLARDNLAMNTSLPVDRQWILARDPDPLVRMHLINRHRDPRTHIPREIDEFLLHDPNPRIRARASVRLLERDLLLPPDLPASP